MGLSIIYTVISLCLLFFSQFSFCLQLWWTGRERGIWLIARFHLVILIFIGRFVNFIFYLFIIFILLIVCYLGFCVSVLLTGLNKSFLVNSFPFFYSPPTTTFSMLLIGKGVPLFPMNYIFMS